MMKELADEQEREVEHAIIKHGKYKSWMSLEQRKSHLNKVAHADVVDVEFLKSLLSGPFSSSSKESGNALSVQIESPPAGVSIPNISLEGIWKKASELLKSGDSIAPAPGFSSEARILASRFNSRPHLVTNGKDGACHCNADCVNYWSMRSCSHVVAVA